MSTSPLYNQYEVNKRSSQTLQNILQKLTIAVYETVKWVINSIGSMIRQFMGK